MITGLCIVVILENRLIFIMRVLYRWDNIFILRRPPYVAVASFNKAPLLTEMILTAI